MGKWSVIYFVLVWIILGYSLTIGFLMIILYFLVKDDMKISLLENKVYSMKYHNEIPHNQSNDHYACGGCSYQYRKNREGASQIAWTTPGGTYLAGDEVTQAFSSESPDINMDITTMAKKWFSGDNTNYGLLIRLSGSRETSSGSFEDIKFFSRQTNTIYSPKIELKWDDHLPATGSNTGSLTELDVSGNSENYLYPIHFREAYKENEVAKFRFGARKRYVQKTFSTSYQTISGSFIPYPSASYSIIDMATNESVVPFSAYTTMSCDTTSNYFKQDLNAFEPNRAYKILVKVNHDDGQEIIYDNDFEFILRT